MGGFAFMVEGFVADEELWVGVFQGLLRGLRNLQEIQVGRVVQMFLACAFEGGFLLGLGERSDSRVLIVEIAFSRTVGPVCREEGFLVLWVGLVEVFALFLDPLLQGLVGREGFWECLFLFVVEILDRLDKSAVLRIVEVEGCMGVALEDFVFFLGGLVYWEFPHCGLEVVEVCFVGSVLSRGKYLDVVKRGCGLVDLEGEVGAFLVEDRVFGVGDVLVPDVGGHFVAEELDGQSVPLAGLEVVCALAMPHGEPRAAGILGRLDEEVVWMDVDYGIVVPRRARDEPQVSCAVEFKVHADEGVFEIGILVKDAFVLSG